MFDAEASEFLFLQTHTHPYGSLLADSRHRPNMQWKSKEKHGKACAVVPSNPVGWGERIVLVSTDSLEPIQLQNMPQRSKFPFFGVYKWMCLKIGSSIRFCQCQWFIMFFSTFSSYLSIIISSFKWSSNGLSPCSPKMIAANIMSTFPGAERIMFSAHDIEVS